jgi:hypothetical protein
VKKVAPAAERNKEPILKVLARVLPPSGRLLEVASGTGQHAVHFAAGLPAWQIQPSDLAEDNLASIQAWADEAALPNLLPPVRLDVCAPGWAPPGSPPDAIFNANMIHIAPWAAALGLLDGAARLLPKNGLLVMYGPYQRGGRHTAESNAAFDQRLRVEDPAWGVRDLDEVAAEAEARGLFLEAIVEMPANNLTVVYRNGVRLRRGSIVLTL